MKLIIDTDPGIDDAMAIAYAAAAPEIDLVGLTTVFGNTHVQQSSRNARFLLHKLGLPLPRGAAPPQDLPHLRQEDHRARLGHPARRAGDRAPVRNHPRSHRGRDLRPRRFRLHAPRQRLLRPARPVRTRRAQAAASAPRCSPRGSTTPTSASSGCSTPTRRSACPTSARASARFSSSRRSPGGPGAGATPGRVIVQTMSPEEPAIRLAASARLRVVCQARARDAPRLAAAPARGGWRA